MRILVLSHALINPIAQARWRKMANVGKNHIQLVVPKRWVVLWFGKKNINNISDEQGDLFSIKTAKTTSDWNFSFYFFRGLRKVISDFKPDVIYPTHESNQTIQMVLLHRFFFRRSKLLFFTMSQHVRTAPPLSFHPRHLIGFCWRRLAWWLLCNGTNGAICHYPAIKDQLRKEGYKKPILIQTQIGVDETIFKPDANERINIRSKLGLNGFIVGFVGRVISDKGIWDIADAISQISYDVGLLIVGDGPDLDKLCDIATEGGWRERLHLQGEVPLIEVANIMQAMDCLFLGSRDTDGWVDTFPNVVAQAMSVGIPVIGSQSGAIPFLLGGRGLLYKQGDIDEILSHINNLYIDESLGIKIGSSLRERALSEFCTESINDKFIDFLRLV